MIILLNKHFIQTAMSIEISKNRRALKPDPAHVYTPPSERESCFHPSSRPMTPKTTSFKDLNVNDRQDVISMTPSDKDVPLYDQVDVNPMTKT